MRWPLIVLSLILLFVYLLRLIPDILPQRRGRFATGSRPNAPSFSEWIDKPFWDTLATYALFAPVAVYMISYAGKPGLLAQYAGWGIVLVQSLRVVTAGRESRLLRFFTGLILLVCLGFLWILQLPLFDPIAV